LRNLIIEVYSKRFAKKNFLAKSLDEAREFLKSLLVPQVDQVIDSLVARLEEQTKNPEMFPNLLLFLNEVDDLVMINDYMGL